MITTSPLASPTVPKATILVTGGTGYIASHTIVELLNDGYQVIIVDDLSNSSSIVIDRIELLTGKMVLFYKVLFPIPTFHIYTCLSFEFDCLFNIFIWLPFHFFL